MGISTFNQGWQFFKIFFKTIKKKSDLFDLNQIFLI